MNTSSKTTGLGIRLGALAAALLFGQQAMAEGTRAGTVISNTATVDYFVAGIDQDDITSDPTTATFSVDRRVNIVLTPDSTDDLVNVTPGGTDYFVDFTLTNLSNDDLDFTLLLAEVAPSDGSVDVDNSGGDTADMGTLDYAVVTATDPTPTRNGEQYVDDLAADGSVRIRVFGDAASTLLNGQIAGAELRATAVELSGNSGAPGAPLSYGDPNTPGGVETVDINGADGVQVAIDGFLVQSADVAITKAFTVIDDGLGGTLAIPGAEVEYVVTLTNAAGAAVATNVEVTDTLVNSLEFLPGGVAGDDLTITVNAGTPAGCTAAADGDDCTVAGQDITFDNITLNAGDTYVFTWRVTIADPATTP